MDVTMEMARKIAQEAKRLMSSGPDREAAQKKWAYYHGKYREYVMGNRSEAAMNAYVKRQAYEIYLREMYGFDVNG